jgi:hypothetical protein
MDIKEIARQTTQYLNEIVDISKIQVPQPVIFIVIAVVVILVCREIVCWYFKQNEQVALLKDIRALLKGDFQEPEPKKKQKRTPIKQVIQNNSHTTEGPKAEDFATKQERLAWLFDQPLNNLTEHNLKELIHETNIADQFEKCKSYLECIITKYPESPYIEFIAKNRLKEISAKLGQKTIGQ